MKFAALISGGKDSIFNTLQCIAMGHELVCVANLYPKAAGGPDGASEETDSYMY